LTGIQKILLCLCLRVCELQRQAAMGYLWLDSHVQQPHLVDLTAHPAYVWLYPQLLSHLTRLVVPCMDYQPEREACFRWASAVPQGGTLWLARSVWHKLREAKVNLQELLNLAAVLPQLLHPGICLPGSRTWHNNFKGFSDDRWFGVRRRSETGGSGHQYLGLPVESIVAFIVTTGQRWISRQPC
jgi:hypothetical protein